ncbi:hypothetical protein Xcel_0362 [Xylanimonas cellulosilytica DSM 15894]|uniref:Uncharacterized protein n=1 Tax=Xylanimonas cellulosilytica (strain DSM 15894 / JCM 12276 / CECT 5975 / KCTC 9989 / LMG 20990 / NBRC 107835 / XIL07) TaxID=446471 RepID=D1BVD0_XYLCX|nr:hypothetical protein [Xylanimonas cellulosilytica]ACZ29401.1 hypothetical protein Xcel_0362 [Xylanimonas cellulosilytica DSM 15894]
MSRSWEELVARFARLSGLVAEVDDPLTWGLDLEEETVTGDERPDDPTSQRFLRSYRTYDGEVIEVETLPSPCPEAMVDDVVRAAASGALAAPLHADLRSPDFAEEFDDYRSAMRAVVEAVDQVPLEQATFVLGGTEVPCTRVVVRGVAAIYAPAGDRAVVVSGSADLIRCVDVVMRPVRSLLQQSDDA